MKRKNSSVRDLIDTGIFTVLYTLVSALGMLGLLAGPYGLLVSLLLSATLGGVVMLPYFARISNPRAFLGLVAIIALVMLPHGWPSAVTALVFGALAVLILQADKSRPAFTFRSQLAYGVFSLWFIGPLLPMLITRQAYFAERSATHGAESSSLMEQVFSVPMILSFDLFVFVAAMFGAWLGAKLTRQYFRPAGQA